MNGKGLNGRVLLDTNILLYYLNGDRKIDELIEDSDLVISFISELELLSAPEIGDIHRKDVQALLNSLSEIITYKDFLKDTIIKVRSKRRLKLPDSIIAATAIYYELPLFTADKGFKNIDGLEIILYDPSVA